MAATTSSNVKSACLAVKGQQLFRMFPSGEVLLDSALQQSFRSRPSTARKGTAPLSLSHAAEPFTMPRTGLGTVAPHMPLDLLVDKSFGIRPIRHQTTYFERPHLLVLSHAASHQTSPSKIAISSVPCVNFPGMEW